MVIESTATFEVGYFFVRTGYHALCRIELQASLGGCLDAFLLLYSNSNYVCLEL